MEKYVDTILTQMDNFDTAVDAAQMEILQKIGLTLDEFSQSIEFFFTHGNQEIYMMTTVIPQKLKY